MTKETEKMHHLNIVKYFGKHYILYANFSCLYNIVYGMALSQKKSLVSVIDCVKLYNTKTKKSFFVFEKDYGNIKMHSILSENKKLCFLNNVINNQFYSQSVDT